MAYSYITILANTGSNFVSGQFVQLIHDTSNYITGQVISYDTNTGVMVIQPTQYVGTGDYSTWQIVASGNAGQATLYGGVSSTTIELNLPHISTSTTTTTTTLSTSTTTTTTTIGYDFYLADEYLCGSCTLQRSSVLVALPSGTSYRIGYFYPDISFSGFVYQLVEVSSSGVAILLDNYARSTCISACVL